MADFFFNTALRTILAAALNAPVRTGAQEEAGAAGAVMMAAVQQGIYADISEATRAWVTPLLQEPEPPDSGLASDYDALFDAYMETRRSMVPVWAAQAAMRKARI